MAPPVHALSVLEFEAVAQRLRQRCEISIAEDLALSLRPSFDEDEVWRQLGLTKEAYELLGRGTPPALGGVKDTREAVTRAGKGGVLTGAETFLIGEGMSILRSLKSFLKGVHEGAPGLKAIADGIPEHPKLDQAILDALHPDGEVKDSASSRLQTIRNRKRSTAARVIERIQAYTSGRTREYLSDPIYTVRDGRYVIPLKAEHKGKIRGIVHDSSSTGQTLFLEPEDVLQLGNALRELEGEEREEVQTILRNFSERIGAVADEVLSGLDAGAHLDLLFAKARYGGDVRGAIPDRAEQMGVVELELARHPLLDPETVVPLSLKVGGPHGSLLITGPNTGGKTVAMKAVGLCVAMAQAGMMPPCAHMRLGVFEQIWADIGDEQSLQQSLSTFSGHIRNIGNALKNLRPNALVLMDEIGAGTDPAEGASLAKAILLRMRDGGATVIASTHYGELKNFAYNTEGFSNAAMEFDAKTLRPTYRLLMGAPGASHALKIAERYGIPSEVVEAAREGLGELAQDMAQMLDRLEESQRLARKAQSEADRRMADLRQKEREAERKLREAEEIRQNARDKATRALEEVLREIRLEADRVFEELRKSGSGNLTARDSARKALRELQEIGDAFAADVHQKPKATGGPKPKLEPGDKVRVQGFTQVGVVLEPVGADRFAVQMGALKMTFASQDLTKSETPPERKARPNLGLQKAQTAHTEIQLIAMRAEEAAETLDRFLDEAVLGGVPTVRIVHGKGEGILRKMVQDRLRRHPAIASYRDGDPEEGGAGVTLAVLK